MNKVLIIAVFTAGLFILNNCSSAPQAENKIVDKRTANTNTQNAKPQMVENGNVVSAPVGNSENVNADVNQLSPLEIKQKRALSNSNSNEKPKTTLVPGSHNSGVGTTMNDKGEFIELRVFNNDPSLKKTERNLNARKITVFLKNGKKYEIAEDKLNNHISASPQEILVAIGVVAPAPTPGARK